MIKKINLAKITPGLEWDNLGRINLIIGEDGSEKSMILDLLGKVSPDLVLIDNFGAFIHPIQISKTLDDIYSRSCKERLQFFLTTNSYCVIKKLYLISQEHNISIPILHKEDGVWFYDDLLDGMPENSLVNASIDLYRQELELML